MQTPIIRALTWLQHQRRAPTDDQGFSTAEALMFLAVSVGILGLIVVPRMEGIVNSVLDTIESALPG